MLSELHGRRQAAKGLAVLSLRKEERSMSAYEREEEAIIDSAQRGEISNAQMMRELRELRRDYAQAARDAAREAYDREIERW